MTAERTDEETTDDWRQVLSAPPPRVPAPPPQPTPGVDVEFDDPRDREWGELQKQRRARTVVECSLLLIVAIWIASDLSWIEFLLAGLLVGPLLGLVVHRTHPGRFGCGLMGLVAFVIVEFGTGVRGGYGSLVTLLWGFVLVTAVFAIYGLRREFRSLEGTG